MNRRDALKTAVAGVAAMCGIKVAKAGPTIRFPASFDGQITSVGWSGMTRREVRRMEHDIHGNQITNSAGEPMTVEVEHVRWIVNSRRFSIHEIAHIFRVPVSMLRDMANGSGGTI